MGLRELIEGTKDYVKEFCYSVYGDTSMEKYILNAELKGMGIINGDDEMIWKSPDKSLIFEVSRDYSNSTASNKQGYQYICTINIKNNIGVPITKLVFTELDAIYILDSFVDFCYPEYYNGYPHSTYININPHNTCMETHTIYLEEIPMGDLTGVLFKINKYNPIYQQVVSVVTIPLTYDQLNDLAFHLFFALLIDIDIPEVNDLALDEVMHKIEDYVTTDKYFIFEHRRKKLEELSKQHPEKTNYAKSFINYNSYILQEQNVIVPMNTVQHIPKKQEQPKKRHIQVQLIRGKKSN